MPSDPPPTSPDDLVGHTVGKYRITRLCGRGGMGSVFEAQNTAIGKRVALKFIDPDHAASRDSVQRFLREAQAASAVESHHIVQIFDVGETDDGQPFLVMELLRGENLGQRLARSTTLPVRDAVHVVAQTLRGLHRAHEAGIVHRDLKPENIFLSENDDDPMFVKIVDFGISKIMRRARSLEASTLTQQGVVLGTPFYMSPEQAQAMPDLDARTDLWSVGAILFECLAGCRPFPGDTYEQVIIAICTRPAPDIRDICPDVSPALAAVIARSMQRDRNQRFQSALEFLEALRLAMPDVVAAVPSSSIPAAHRTWQSAGAAPPPPADVPPSRTQSSWSAGRPHPMASPAVSDSTPNDLRRRRLRLAVVGVASGLGAFALTVGWIARTRSQPDRSAVSVVQSSVTTPPAVSARVVTGRPDAVIYIDAHLSTDGWIRGSVGSTHIVRVELPGRPAVEKSIRLDGVTTEVRVEAPIEDAGPADVDAATPSVTEAEDAGHEKRRTPGRPPSSTSVPGRSLELKTDIP